MVCSGALLYGYKCLYTNDVSKDTIDTISIDTISIDTISIDSYDLFEDIINDNKDNILEGSFIEKMDKIMDICENKCNFKIKLNNNKKKNRQKLARFINEYNTIGNNSFIKKYKKKNI